MSLELTFPKDVFLGSRVRGQSWEESITGFIKKTTSLVQEKVPDEAMDGYVADLASALGEMSTYIYWTRKYRDKALAEGYEKYPKPQYNSEAQVALARQYASSEVRLHELMKDMRDALKTRLYLGRDRLEK